MSWLCAGARALLNTRLRFKVQILNRVWGREKCLARWGEAQSGLNQENPWGSCAVHATCHYCVWIFLHPCCLHGKGNMERPWGKDVSKANGDAGSGYIHVPLLTQGSGAEMQEVRRITNWSWSACANCLKTKRKKGGLGKRKPGWLQI